MKKSLKKALKTVGIFAAAVCFLCGVTLVIFAVQGAVMYRSAVSERPVSAAAEEIMSRDDYVPLRTGISCGTSALTSLRYAAR